LSENWSGKFKSPSALGAGGLLQSWVVFLLTLASNQDAEVRWHTRRVMMVVMAMVDANWHLLLTLPGRARGVK